MMTNTKLAAANVINLWKENEDDLDADVFFCYVVVLGVLGV